MNDLALTNANSLWGYFLAETLAKCGVGYAVVSPGSRSTPILWGLAHCDAIEKVPILDERGAAFFALGLAKQTGRPVVLSCTSGTAAANYFPAIVEARESGVPLLVLTADRPPELRRCAAGQTVDQVKMYGSNALDYLELPVPEATKSCLRHLRQTISHALSRTMLPTRGPVHVNCPLREPLAPEPGKTLALDFDPDELLDGVCAHKYAPPVPRFDNLSIPPEIRRGLIVAGTVQADDDEKARRALWNLATKSGWPMICDILGPWRAGIAENVTRVSAYDAILSNAENKKSLAPDFVLQIGRLPTSKALREWLACLDLPTLVASTSTDNINPAHSRAQSVLIAPENIDAISLPRCGDDGYATAWGALETACRNRINSGLDGCEWMFEGLVSREIFRTLPTDARLFIANSMSVRDAESFAECGHEPFRVFFNRGANGIDGTLATALGCAHEGGGVLLAGDLALLHDAGSLAIARAIHGSLTIVLVDNNGGGIFEKLPVAQIDDQAFEKYFATPQSVDFAALAKAHHVDYETITNMDELREKLPRTPVGCAKILHLKTDRKRDTAFRRKLVSLK